MRAHSSIISFTGLVVKRSRMETSTQGNGSMAKNMVKVFTSMQTESITKEIGKTIKKTVTADSNGQTAPGTRETTCKATSTGEESSCMKMAHFMKVNFTVINCKVTELSHISTPRNTSANF